MFYSEQPLLAFLSTTPATFPLAGKTARLQLIAAIAIAFDMLTL